MKKICEDQLALVAIYLCQNYRNFLIEKRHETTE